MTEPVADLSASATPDLSRHNVERKQFARDGEWSNTPSS